MTITLEIPQEMEAQLCERAARRGQTVTDYLMTLAESEDYFSIYEWDDEADRRETMAAIEQWLEELRAGDQGMLLEDYRAQVMSGGSTGGTASGSAAELQPREMEPAL